jgi:hypothetical protein
MKMLYRQLGTPAYEDGTERVFRNIGTQNSDARELPRRKDTTFKTQPKFEIKNFYPCWTNCVKNEYYSE